jgi:tRNA(Leu) C34 or U34 (ribose-2'-O)-methylase TrmL
MAVAVLLHDPKHGENVGGAIRACAAFDVPTLRWTGSRVRDSKRVARYGRLGTDSGATVDHGQDAHAFDDLVSSGLCPVAVELGHGASALSSFEHPEDALYVFGPEDSSLSKGFCQGCSSQVFVPTLRCLNLAACVNVVLYDRVSKLGLPGVA